MNVKDLDIELRKKVFGAFNDEKRQIGDVTYTPEERAQLKEFYSSFCLHQNWTPEATELVTAFLVSVIKNYKGDWTGKEFWDRIYPQIGWKPDYTVGLPAIGDALARYRRPLFISKSGIHKYVESLFYQAYSPQTSVKSFIKLAWSLYTNPDIFDLTYFDSDSDGRLCGAIIESLNRHYKDVDFDSDFEFESSTYSIRAGLRYAFADDQKGATHMLRRILKYIDFIYQHRDKVDEDAEGYLGRLCNESVPKLIASYSETESISRSPRARETIDDIERIKATYLIHNNSLNIYFPKIRLFRDNQQFKTATVTLFLSVDNERMEIAKRVYECVGEDYKHILREIYFPIDDYLDYFGDDIKLVATMSFDGNEPVFDSKHLLFRKFIVFKDDSESKSTLLTPGDYRIIYPTNFLPTENIHSSEEPIIRSSHMFDISLNEGDRVSYNGYYVFFGQKETGAHFFFDEHGTLEVGGVVFKGNSSEPYSVYKSLGNLIIRTDEVVKPDHLDVQIYSDDGAIIFRCPLTKLFSENGIYSLPLEKEILNAANNNLHLIVVAIKDQSADKYYYNKHLVVLPDIKVTYGESPYANESLSYNTLFFLGETYLIPNAPQTAYEEVDTKIGIAEVQLPFFSWRINQEDYHWDKIDETLPMLLEEFQSNDILYVNTFYKDIKVFCGDNEILESNKKGQFLLGQFVHSPTGHEAFIRGDHFYAMVETNGERLEFPLFAVTSEPYLLDEDSDCFISFENGTLVFNVRNNFHGNQYTRFKIELEGQSSNGYKYKGEGNLFDGIIISNVSSDVYDVSISYKEPYTLGDYWTHIWSGELELGDLNEIRFKDVSRINITKISRCKMKNMFLTNISYMEDDGFGLRYRCKIYSDTLKGEYCEFVINDGTRLFSPNIPIVSLHYRDNGEIKEFSFDTVNNSLSKHQTDGERYHECLSIYSKTE